MIDPSISLTSRNKDKLMQNSYWYVNIGEFPIIIACSTWDWRNHFSFSSATFIQLLIMLWPQQIFSSHFICFFCVGYALYRYSRRPPLLSIICKVALRFSAFLHCKPSFLSVCVLEFEIHTIPLTVRIFYCQCCVDKTVNGSTVGRQKISDYSFRGRIRNLQQTNTLIL